MGTRKMKGGAFFKKPTGNERGWRNWAKAVFSGQASQLNSEEMKKAIRKRRNEKVTKRAIGRNALLGALRNKGIVVPSTGGPRPGSVAAQTAAARSVARAVANGTSTTAKMRRPGFYRGGPRAGPNSNLPVGIHYPLFNNGPSSTRRGSPGRTAARLAPGSSRQLASAARAAASMAAYAPYEAPPPPLLPSRFNKDYAKIRKGLEKEGIALTAALADDARQAAPRPGPPSAAFRAEQARVAAAVAGERAAALDYYAALEVQQRIKKARKSAYKTTYNRVHNNSVRNGNNEVTAHRKAVNAAKLAEEEAAFFAGNNV